MPKHVDTHDDGRSLLKLLGRILMIIPVLAIRREPGSKKKICRIRQAPPVTVRTIRWLAGSTILIGVLSPFFRALSLGAESRTPADETQERLLRCPRPRYAKSGKKINSPIAPFFRGAVADRSQKGSRDDGQKTVMFVVEVGAVLTTFKLAWNALTRWTVWVSDANHDWHGPTVLFANFA